MSVQLQVKLLRFLQERQIERVSGRETIRVDVRVIAATNKDVVTEMQAGRFREDLYYRLSVVNLNVPPLRERGEDIVILANAFLRRRAQELRRKLRFGDAALEAMTRYRWPGNVRELENTIERAVVLCTTDRIGPDLLPDYLRYPVNTDQPSMTVPTEGLSLKDAVSRYERAMILQSLELANGVQKRAAELLQLKPSTLNEMMKRLGIHTKSNAVIEDEVTVAE